jgi:uncharacterized protein with HEPN domain
MPRDSRVYLEDILASIQKVKAYTNGLSLTKFLRDDKTFDAVVRNLEVIGEAAKHLPEAARKTPHDVDWKKIAGPMGYPDPRILWNRWRDCLGHCATQTAYA